MPFIVPTEPYLIMVYATGSAIDEEVGPRANALFTLSGSNATAIL